MGHHFTKRYTSFLLFSFRFSMRHFFGKKKGRPDQPVRVVEGKKEVERMCNVHFV